MFAVSGVLLLVRPLAGIIVVIWAIRAYAVLAGILLIILGFRLRSPKASKK